MSLPLIIKMAADQSAQYGNAKDPAKRKTPLLAAILGGQVAGSALRAPARLAAHSLGNSLKNTPLLPGEADIGDRLLRKFSPGTAEIGDTADAASYIARKFPSMIRDRAQEAIEMQLDAAGPHYNPATKKIYNVGKGRPISLLNSKSMTQTPGVIGHELGHALNHKLLGRLYPPLMTASRYSMFGALPIGIIGYLRHRDSDRNKANKWRDASLAIGGAGTAATLLDEGTASLRAMKMLKSLNPGKAILAANKAKLGKAFGTYAAMGTIPLALAGGLYALDANAYKRKQEAMRQAADPDMQ